MLEVMRKWQEGKDHFIEVKSDSRSELSDDGRRFALDHVSKDFPAGMEVGLEPGDVLAFHPDHPDKDPYAVLNDLKDKTQPVWWYRQVFKVQHKI